MKKLFVYFLLIAMILMTGCSAAPAAEAPAAEAPAAAEAEVKEAAQPAAAEEEKEAVMEEESAEAVEIVFWSWVPEIQTQVDQWNETHPDIQVSYRNAGSGNTEYTVLNTALEANTDIPDVVQIEYQHLPGYIVQDALLNLADYGANDVKDQFVSWTWAQVSQGDGVYAYPQDAGPMIMMCNNAVLDEYGIEVPTTWEEFAAASAALHEANPDAYLSNLTADQGHFFGLLWQSGAQPFKVNGHEISIDFTSEEVMRVARFWGGMLDDGVLSSIDTYTNDWQTALGNGSIACWTAGAWGTYISGYAPDYAGEWGIYLMPQWSEGGKVNGNYGGSTIAVTKATKNPEAAVAFAQWLNTDADITLQLTAADKAALFPVTQQTLANPEWLDVTDDFWGGGAIHQVMAEAAQQVDVNFGWSPFTNYVYTSYGDLLVEVRAGGMTFEEAIQKLQDMSVAFAEEQGYTVVP